jgi:hypothetical protein
VSGQEGNALAVLNVAHGAGLRLGSTYESAAGVIRLCATSEARTARVTSLQAGDLLLITGRTPTGEIRTALAQLSGPPVKVAVPTPTKPDGTELAAYFEATVDPVDAGYGYGLWNSDRTVREAPSILEDAAVATLDRSEPIVVFYTARDASDGRLKLYRAAGNPAYPAVRDVLVEDAARPLRVETVHDAAGGGGAYDGVAERLREVRVWAPVAARDGGAVRAEVVEVRLEMPHGAALRRPVKLVWDALVVESSGPPTSGPGPGPGPGPSQPQQESR